MFLSVCVLLWHSHTLRKFSSSSLGEDSRKFLDRSSVTSEAGPRWLYDGHRGGGRPVPVFVLPECHVCVVGQDRTEDGQRRARDGQHVAPPHAAVTHTEDTGGLAVVLEKWCGEPQRKHQQSGQHDQHCKHRQRNININTEIYSKVL